MEELPFLTALPPTDERRFLYTYYGQRVLSSSRKGIRLNPLYVHNQIRSEATFLIGQTSPTKRDFLINQAIRDVSCGRSVVFIDGTYDHTILDQLYYWSRKRRGYLLYAFTPSFKATHDSHSWNPLICPSLSPGIVAETFLNSFVWSRAGGRIKNMEFQREAFSLLYRAIVESGYVCNCHDLVDILENENVLKWLGKLLVQERGKEFYDELMELVQKQGGLFRKVNELSSFLRHFHQASLGSYNPKIRLDEIGRVNCILYVGLADVARDITSAAIGNVMLNQLQALISTNKIVRPGKGPGLTIILHQAGPFLDGDITSWMCEKLPPNLILDCSINSVQDLQNQGAGFLKEISHGRNNILLFPTQDTGTIDWFTQTANMRQQSIQRHDKQVLPDITSEEVRALQPTQYLAQVGHEHHPFLTVSPWLPKPPDRQDCRYIHEHYRLLSPPILKGLFAHRQLNNYSPKNNNKT